MLAERRLTFSNISDIQIVLTLKFQPFPLGLFLKTYQVKVVNVNMLNHLYDLVGCCPGFSRSPVGGAGRDPLSNTADPTDPSV